MPYYKKRYFCLELQSGPESLYMPSPSVQLLLLLSSDNQYYAQMAVVLINCLCND